MIALHPLRRLPAPEPSPSWQVSAAAVAATPWWARAVLPRQLPVLVPATPSSRPRWRAGVWTALACVSWGAIIGAAFGAAAGTVVLPVFYTVVGGAVGAAVGAGVGAVWAPLTVGVLAARHRTVAVAHACVDDVAKVLGALVGVFAIIGVWAIGAVVLNGEPAAVALTLGIVAVALACLVRLLRRAAVAISVAWCSPFGWRRG